MFAWVRKLFRQIVNWFRPENGGHALTIPVHPCPPRSIPVHPRIPKHEEVPAESEATPPPASVASPLKETLIIARRETSVIEPHYPHVRDKWLHPVRKPRDPNAPRKSRKPRTVLELEPKLQDDAVFQFRADNTHKWDLRPQSEDTGVFYFRGALLDRLDVYFRAIARMKRAHRDAYNLYTQIGGTMIPENTLGAAYQLPAFWHTPKDRPAFGCVHLGHADVNHDCMLQMMYFEKMSDPGVEVERAPGADVYEVSAYLDDLAPDAMDRVNKVRSKKWRRWLQHCGCVFQFWIAVGPNGEMWPLKTLQTEWKHITYRAGTGRYGKTRKEKFGDSIPQKHWAYPANLRWWWKEYHENAIERNDKFPDTLEEWACSTLRLIANYAQSAELGVRISVENEHQHHAVFALDWKRTSYFFKDRDTVLTPKGKPARIFHIVKPHLRKKADGTESAVHLHFRGLRRFKWGNYNVHITVPGLHHIPLTDFTVGLNDMTHRPPEEWVGTMSVKQIGEKLAAHLDERKALGEIFK